VWDCCAYQCAESAELEVQVCERLSQAGKKLAGHTLHPVLSCDCDPASKQLLLLPVTMWHCRLATVLRSSASSPTLTHQPFSSRASLAGAHRQPRVQHKVQHRAAPRVSEGEAQKMQC
jgi:hypothetical protein